MQVSGREALSTLMQQAERESESMGQLTYADAVGTSGVCWAWQLEPLLTLASAALGAGNRLQETEERSEERELEWRRWLFSVIKLSRFLKCVNTNIMAQ